MAKRGINKVILVGRIGKDPETKYLTDSNVVTNISIATSESWKDKTSGEQVEKTEWHRVVFFGKLAEIAGEYLRKGSKVYIEGRLQTRKWQDQSGQDRYTTEIVANDMQMLDSKSDAAQQSNLVDSTLNAMPQASQQPAGLNTRVGQSNSGFDEMDIPF